MIMLLKRKKSLFSPCFYFWMLKGTLLAAVSTLTSTHVPEEVNLWGILAGVRLRKPKTILSSWEVFKDSKKRKKTQVFQ